MGRFLLCTAGSLGDLHPYLAVGRGLQARGHAVAVATMNHWRDAVAYAGLEHRPIAPDLSPEDPEVAQLAADPKRGSENVFKKLIAPRLEEGYHSMAAAWHEGELAVGHPLALGLPVLARKRGWRWASAALAPISFFSMGEPIHIGGHPVVSALTRWPLVHRLLRWGGRMQTRSWVAGLHAIREREGVPYYGHPIFEGQHSPYCVLALFSPLFGPPQADWPANTVATGFPVYDRVDGHAVLPPDLEAFLETGPPPVAFTLGSAAIFDPRGFWQASVAGARAVGRRAVLLIGRGTEPPDVPPAGDVCVAEYAPYSLLFPRCAAVVLSTGIGSSGQALRAGRPVVAVPYGNDQPDNAARLARLGVARVVPAGRYSTRRVTAALQQVLGDPAVRERATAIGDRIRSEDAVAAACDALENCAAE